MLVSIAEQSSNDVLCYVLNWMQRVKIAIGVACGMVFLHAQNPPIFCGSVRVSNIVMFNHDVAKIGDFTPDYIHSRQPDGTEVPSRPLCAPE